jgi:hypothetical protein
LYLENAFRAFRTENNENRAIARKAISYQMAEPEIEKRSDRVIVAAVATKRTSQTSDTNGATPPADKPAPDALTKEATYSTPPDYLDDALKHAERLLK